MQTRRYELEGLAQDNTVLTGSNSAVMEQFAQMTVTMNTIQAQLETLNKIEISNPKINLINYIDTPPNPTSNNVIAISDSICKYTPS